MDVADAQTSAGWVFLNGSTCPSFMPEEKSETPEKLWLHSVYQAQARFLLLDRLPVAIFQLSSKFAVQEYIS